VANEFGWLNAVQLGHLSPEAFAIALLSSPEYFGDAMANAH
jgi:hypothetical protein